MIWICLKCWGWVEGVDGAGDETGYAAGNGHVGFTIFFTFVYILEKFSIIQILKRYVIIDH